METQTKEIFEQETHCQEDGQKNKENQDAWIQDTQSGNSLEEEINRLKTLLDKERAKFNKEHDRANNLEEELLKLKLEKCEFNENDIGLCSEAKKGWNTSEDMENKALQDQLRTSQDKAALLQQEIQENTALYQEVLAKLQNDVVNLSEQVATLQEELEMERSANSQNANKMFFQIRRGDSTAQITELKKEIALLRKTTSEKERQLQEELHKMTESSQDLKRNYQTSVNVLVQQTETLKKKLRDNEKAHSEMLTMNQVLQAGLEAENEALRQQLTSQQNATIETETRLQSELEQIKEVNLEMVQKYEADILALREEIQTMEQEHRDERYRHAEIEIRNGKRAKFLHAEKNMLQKELDEVKRKLFLDEVEHKKEMDSLTAEMERQLQCNYKLSEELKQKEQENDEAKAPLPEKKPLLKKLRHALGLRKPERWKKREVEENE